jgi:cysteine desulfurase
MEICPQNSRPVYLDHHATTPVDPRVAEAMVVAMTQAFGNPNSADHVFGHDAARAIVTAAQHVGELAGGEADHVRFTSGASEALRLALAYAVERVGGRKLRIAASRIEHPALIDALEKGERAGAMDVTWLPVNDQARVSVAVVSKALDRELDLLCLMAANNEVGTIQPIAAVAELATRSGTDLLVDATQAAGKIPLRAAAWGVEYLVLSAHKIYGPKGVGALVSPAVSTDPLPPPFDVHESTPNVPGVVGLGEASRIAKTEMASDEIRIAALRDRLEARLLTAILGLTVNGDRANRLAGNLHISIPGVPNDAVVASVRHAVALSTGAACASGADAPSHVLRAMDIADWRQEGALRMSVGRFTTEEEIDRAAAALEVAVDRVRNSMQAFG